MAPPPVRWSRLAGGLLFLSFFLSFFGLSMAPGGGIRAATAALLSPAELRWFVEHHVKGSPSATPQALQGFGPLLARREHLDLPGFHLPQYPAVECLLQRAVDRKLTVTELFTDPLFAPAGPLALVLERPILARLEDEFDLHSLFLILATDLDKQPLRMQFFLIGQGRLILGYDHNGTIKHPDPAYQVATGKYEYRRLVLMQVGRDAQGRGRFSALKTLANHAIDEPYADFIGPLNVAVQSMFVAGTEQHIEVKRFGIVKSETLRLPPVERRHPLALTDRTRLASQGCPVGGSWGLTPP